MSLKDSMSVQKKYSADIIVRITSDCPLIDPVVVENVIKLFKSENADYASNNLKKTFPHGLDTEVFSFKALSEAHQKAKKPFEREHVTQYIRHRPKKFKLSNLSSLGNYYDIRVTLDEEEDMQMIALIIKLLGDKVNLEQIVSLFASNPELKKINSEAGIRHAVYNKEQNIK